MPELEAIPAELKVTAIWSDQGTGTAVAALKLILRRSFVVIAEKNLFGTYDRSGNQKLVTIAGTEDVVKKAKIGDRYVI